MHEYPATQKIIKTAERFCNEASAGKVVRITLVVGDYSGFIGESIQMYFNIISEGTLCEGAVIDVERVIPMINCPACSKLFTRKPLSFACPICGADGEPTDIGKEFHIKEIEVE
jgi:hydrogenase nickel incorporation protein HypA/HybF